MTRCASEERHPAKGLAWTPPTPLPLPIEMPRITARLYEPADADQLHAVVSACRDSLMPWLPWSREDHADPERSLHFIVNHRVSLRDPAKLNAIVLGLFDRDTGRLLGGHGIHDIRRDTASCETGYWLAPEARGQGLITQATAHILSWCFRPQTDHGMGLRRARIYCSGHNEPSKRIPQRLGLRQEVTQREDSFLEGLGLTDRLGWGVMATEWDTLNHRFRPQ